MARKERTFLQRQQASEALSKWHREKRATAPLCGAKTKPSGEPCRQVAMANGRCYRHGGKTPKGDGWHKPKWPKGNSPAAERKLRSKLKALERARRERGERVASMTVEERARYDEWLRTHQPGSMGARQAAKERRRQNAEARADLERAENAPRPVSPELERLENLIAELETEKLILERGSVFD